MRIGVVSDTHGLLRPQVLPLLTGSAAILHLGDVGDPGILEALASVAPVVAIRGNIDTKGPCAHLPETEVIEFKGRSLYLLHDLNSLDLDPAVAGFDAVLFGHSHRPEIRRQKGVLYFNPGSCGPRRFQLPITCGRLELGDDGSIKAEVLELSNP